MEIENLVRLIETVSASELTEFQYEEQNVKLHMKTADENIQIVQSTQEIPKTVPEKKEEKAQGDTVLSPLVGTYYEAPAEDADPFVKVGDTVKKGQTMAIIEAMKLMNEIESEYDGIVTEILVKNGQPVEYGQPLFRISQ